VAAYDIGAGARFRFWIKARSLTWTGLAFAASRAADLPGTTQQTQPKTATEPHVHFAVSPREPALPYVLAVAQQGANAQPPTICALAC